MVIFGHFWSFSGDKMLPKFTLKFTFFLRAGEIVLRKKSVQNVARDTFAK